MMQRTPMARGSGFKRKVYQPPAASPARRLAHEPNYEGSTTGPAPKNPADRKQAMRDLAMGEECQVRYAPVCRHPATEYTVLAHTNTQADQKGMGYKGHDSAGVLSCDRCHEILDASRDLLPAHVLEEIWRAAKERTLIRLRFLANSITDRPWRVAAARWAVEQIEKRAESCSKK